MANEKILVLESGKETLAARVKALQKEGYQIVVAATMEQALQLLEEQPYELLIIHAAAPELLSMLLARFPADLAVLIVSPATVIGSIVESAGGGLHTFLVEPCGTRKLREAIGRTIARRRQLEESLRTKAFNALGRARHLIASGFNMDRFFSIVTEMTAAGTGADYVALFARDEATKEYRQRARWGECPAGGEELCRQVVGQVEPVVLAENMENSPPLTARMVASGVSSLLSMPLLIRGEVIGAIAHLKASGKTPFTTTDAHFVSVLSWWSSIALENIRLFQRVEQQQTHVDDLLQELSHAQENERKRVAIEIHDGVAQWMVGATYNLKACSSLISQSRLTELEAELNKISDTLQRSVRELRRTIANLRPIALEEGGLMSAIRQATRQMAEEKVLCHLHIEEGIPPLTFPQETTTYWILQEAMTNIRTHSRASEVHLHIGYKNGQVWVRVADNGKGFDPAEVLRSVIPLEHMGLLGMQERARLLGGTFTIDSKPGEGTTISFLFPVTAYEMSSSVT